LQHPGSWFQHCPSEKNKIKANTGLSQIFRILAKNFFYFQISFQYTLEYAPGSGICLVDLINSEYQILKAPSGSETTSQQHHHHPNKDYRTCPLILQLSSGQASLS
jgi:hypothetical protein